LKYPYYSRNANDLNDLENGNIISINKDYKRSTSVSNVLYSKNSNLNNSLSPDLIKTMNTELKKTNFTDHLPELKKTNFTDNIQ